MIVKDHELPLVITSQLDKILGRWALYRSQGPKTGRKIAPEYWELWQRPGSQPLTQVAKWELHQFPGCAHVGVSAKVEVNAPWRGRGLGHLTLQIREQIARRLGYKQLLATVRSDNTAETKVIYRGGWDSVAMLNNAADPVYLWRKNL